MATAITTAPTGARVEQESVEPEAVDFSAPSALPEPGTADVKESRALLRLVFKYVNRYLMVPVFRLGLGRLTGSPASGYIMVLRTTGRKSGTPRYVPLNYAISGGNVYCIAGWGRTCHWFANLKADPYVELLLPGGAFAGIAEEVSDPQEARLARVRVARNSGFALMFEGLNPATATDAQILGKVEDVPVVRVRPTGVGSGPHDPGGLGWVIPIFAQLAGLIWLIGRRRSASKR